MQFPSIMPSMRVQPLLYMARVLLLAAFLFFVLIVTNSSLILRAQGQVATTTSSAISALRERIREYIQRDEYQTALYYVQAQAAATGWTTDLHRLAGDLWRSMGDDARAIPHWEAVIAQTPDADLLRTLADVHLQRGDWERAFERLERLVEQLPADGWGQYHLGALLAPSNPARALRHLSQVRLNSAYFNSAQQMMQILSDTTTTTTTTTNAPDDLIVDDMPIGAFLAHAGEWSLAENAFMYAAAVNHPYPEALAYIALMRAQQGKRGEAWLDEALRLTPNDPNVLYVAGIYYRLQEAHPQSVDMLQWALALEPDNAIFYAELGLTYQLMGDFVRARDVFERAGQIAADDEQMAGILQDITSNELYMLPPGYLTLTRGADDPAVLAAQGWQQHLNGDTAGGLATIETALQRDPQNARARFEKARILLDTGRADDAVLLLRGLVADNTLYASAAEGLLDTLDDQ